MGFSATANSRLRSPMAAAVSSAKSATQDAPSRAGNGHGDKAPVPEFSKEQELVAYREMLAIRRFEEKAGQMYGMGLIGGFCHLYIGQEEIGRASCRERVYVLV